MKKQVLSIEQMKHLQELELDTSDASMTWMLYPYEENKQPKFNLRKWNTFKEPFRKQHCISAFTLQDILDKLPHYINPVPSKQILFAWMLERDTIAYRNVENVNDCLKHFTDASLIDAVYEMLCWCVENGYIKTK